jgi:SAM-dependent methyltransferase
MASGAGSCGRAAHFKADFLNEFVSEQRVSSVIEFGCGDGQQLALARYPAYIGLDVSRTAVDLCKRRFSNDPTKTFYWLDALQTSSLGDQFVADLTISLDVIYHLLEEEVYDIYLSNLFRASRRFVIVYSSDCNAPTRFKHVRHRRFTSDVACRYPQFELVSKVKNPHRDDSFADFHVFKHVASP